MQNAARDVNGAIKYIVEGEKEHPNRFDVINGKVPSRNQPQAPTMTQQAPTAFGQQSSLNQPSTSQASSNSAFGQPSAFSRPTPSVTALGQPSAFGQPTGLGQSAPAFGQPAALGQSVSPFASRTSAFGQPSAMNTGSVFGQPSNLSTFGQPSNPSAFDQPSNPFSQHAPSGPSAFGQSLQPSAFGQPSQPSAFGQPSQPSVFGQPSSVSALGQPPKQPSTFGQPNQPSAFGQPSQPSSIFGKPSPPSNLGGQAQTSAFGPPSQPANSQPRPFGQPSQPASFQPNPFGQPSQLGTSKSFSNQPVPAFSTGVSTTSIAAPSNPFAAAGSKPDSPPRGRSLTRTFGHPSNTPTTAKAPMRIVFAKKDPNRKLHTTWGIPITPQNTRKSVEGKLSLWKGLPVEYVDEDPCFKREDGKWEKILYPDGPPQWSKPEMLPREPYDDFTINAYKTMMETGDFGLGPGEGLIPDLPPKREWITWDF